MGHSGGSAAACEEADCTTALLHATVGGLAAPGERVGRGVERWCSNVDPRAE